MNDAIYRMVSVHVAMMLFLVMTLGSATVEAAPSLPRSQATCDPSKSSCVDEASKKPECPEVCFVSLEGKIEFVRSENCTLPLKDACTEGWRLDKKFLEKSEGELKVEGYVPTYDKDIKDKNGKIIHKKGEVVASSGVTISTGIDLGQQSAAGTKAILDAYIKDRGNPGKVDVAALMKKLDPYFELQKQKAVDALGKTPLSVTKAEAELLADAFRYDTLKKVATQFDKKNTQQMVFKKLPMEAQTVIVDFAYQYGLSDTKGDIRKTFWTYVYDGAWQKLADWLLSRPDQYTTRREREGDVILFGVENDYLPESGNPCPSASQGGVNQSKP